MTDFKDHSPDPRPITIIAMHSTFCGECGGWGGNYLEQVSEHAWFLRCFGCDEILLNFRAREAREESNQERKP